MTIRNFKVNLNSKQLFNVKYLSRLTFYFPYSHYTIAQNKLAGKLLVGKGVDSKELKGTLEKSPALILICLLRGM